MRRHLGTVSLVALLLAAACGEDPAADGPHLAEIVAIAGVGGEVSPRAVSLDDRAALDEFTQRFDDPEDVAQRLVGPMRQAEDDGVRLAAALVSVGCDVPPGVEVTETDGELRVIAEPIPDTGRQCLVPLSAVALVVVPE